MSLVEKKININNFFECFIEVSMLRKISFIPVNLSMS